jgi:hypothetical protein
LTVYNKDGNVFLSYGKDETIQLETDFRMLLTRTMLMDDIDVINSIHFANQLELRGHTDAWLGYFKYFGTKLHIFNNAITNILQNNRGDFLNALSNLINTHPKVMNLLLLVTIGDKYTDVVLNEFNRWINIIRGVQMNDRSIIPDNRSVAPSIPIDTTIGFTNVVGGSHGGNANNSEYFRYRYNMNKHRYLKLLNL